MAWDFETDPEFEAELAWMREFIDTELIPIEPILRELPADEWAVVKRHLQDRVKAAGPLGRLPRSQRSAAPASGSSSWR